MILTIYGLGAYDTKNGPISISPQGYDLVVYQGFNVGYIIFDTSEALAKHLATEQLYKDLNKFNAEVAKAEKKMYYEVNAIYNAHKL